MSTLQNTDLFAVHRGTETYKVNYGDILAGVTLPNALEYKGVANPTQPVPSPAGGLKTGMVYVLSPSGTIHASWTGVAGLAATDGQLAAWEGAKWELMGDNGLTQPDATETAKGIVELATAAETTTGTDKTRAVHPAGLKAALDAVNVRFTQAGTGAVQRTVASKLQEVVSVKDFGAVGDGVANDTVAIQAAIAYACGAADSIKTPSVYFPSGEYLVSHKLDITAPIDIIGDGPESSIIKDTYAFALFRVVIDSAAGGQGRKARFRDLAIYGADDPLLTNQDGIQVTSGTAQRWLDVDNVLIRGLGGNGIVVDTTVSVRINRTSILFCKRDGIVFQGGECTDTRITECFIRYNRVGIAFNANVYSVWIKGCLIENNTNGAGALGGAGRPGYGIENKNLLQIFTIQDCYFEGQAYPIVNSGNLFQEGLIDSCYFNANLSTNYLTTTVPFPHQQRPLLSAGGSGEQSIRITNCTAPGWIEKPGGISDSIWGTTTAVTTITGEGSSGSSNFIVSATDNLYPDAQITIAGIAGTTFTVTNVPWYSSSGVSSTAKAITVNPVLPSAVSPGTVVTILRGAKHPSWNIIGAYSSAENNNYKNTDGSYTNPYYLPSASGVTTALGFNKDPGVTSAYYSLRLPERATITCNNELSTDALLHTFKVDGKNRLVLASGSTTLTDTLTADAVTAGLVTGKFATGNTSGASTSAYLRAAITGNSSATGNVGINIYSNNVATRYAASFSNPNGVVGSISTTASATAYTTSSDYRLKENVTLVSDGITRLQQLKPSRFNFIAAPGHTVDGFIAHEAQTVVPECVTGTKDEVDADGNPVYQGIDQSKLVPLLTAALQEAIGEIESLKARVAALETP